MNVLNWKVEMKNRPQTNAEFTWCLFWGGSSERRAVNSQSASERDNELLPKRTAKVMVCKLVMSHRPWKLFVIYCHAIVKTEKKISVIQMLVSFFLIYASYFWIVAYFDSVNVSFSLFSFGVYYQGKQCTWLITFFFFLTVLLIQTPMHTNNSGFYFIYYLDFLDQLFSGTVFLMRKPCKFNPS